MSFSKNPDLFISFSEHVVQETITLIEYLCDLFTARVKKVVISNYKIWMLDIVEERQGAFSYDAEIWNIDNRTDEQSRHVLLDLNPRSLVFRQKTSDQFRIENFHKKYHNLTIYGGTWITVENLCQLDCVELNIFRYFSNTEINQYLKHVLSGGAPRLRKFFAEVQNANEDAILDGIRELLTESERFEEERGYWTVNDKVAREEGLVEVSIKKLCSYVFLEIKET